MKLVRTSLVFIILGLVVPFQSMTQETQEVYKKSVVERLLETYPEYVQEINDRREERGLQRLRSSNALTTVALSYAYLLSYYGLERYSQGAHHYITYQEKTSLVRQAASSAGNWEPHFLNEPVMMAENLGYYPNLSYVTPEEQIQGFEDSPPHRDAMYSDRWNYVGYAYFIDAEGQIWSTMYLAE